MSVTAVFLALLAGACFSLASVLQHHEARQEPGHEVLDPRLVLRLLRRPLWLAGRLIAVIALVVQGTALHYGALSGVQVLMVGGLFLIVPLEARLDHRRAARSDLRAVLIAGSGLALFLAVATPEEGTGRPDALSWMLVLGGSGLVVALLLAGSRARPAASGVLLGLATGVVYGASAALLKSGVDGNPLLYWTSYVWAATAALGLVLSQNAFQTGAAAGPLTAVAVGEPLTAMCIGVTAFHERLDVAGPGIALMVAGAAAMAVGVRHLYVQSPVAAPQPPGVHPFAL